METSKFERGSISFHSRSQRAGARSRDSVRLVSRITLEFISSSFIFSPPRRFEMEPLCQPPSTTTASQCATKQSARTGSRTPAEAMANIDFTCNMCVFGSRTQKGLSVHLRKVHGISLFNRPPRRNKPQQPRNVNRTSSSSSSSISTIGDMCVSSSYSAPAPQSGFYDPPKDRVSVQDQLPNSYAFPATLASIVQQAVIDVHPSSSESSRLRVIRSLPESTNLERPQYACRVVASAILRGLAPTCVPCAASGLRSRAIYSATFKMVSTHLQSVPEEQTPPERDS